MILLSDGHAFYSQQDAKDWTLNCERQNHPIPFIVDDNKSLEHCHRDGDCILMRLLVKRRES